MGWVGVGWILDMGKYGGVRVGEAAGNKCTWRVVDGGEGVVCVWLCVLAGWVAGVEVGVSTSPASIREPS